VFVNFKTYPRGTGEKAVELAKAIREVSQVSGESGIQIIPVVQAVDVF
ncbi:triose-phosphate isomerase, partial [Candidatus Shapirobacteria bacterium CG07_land_8_20_14_0_80_39_18]